MNEVKVTSKMKMVLQAIKEIGGAAFAREVLEYLDANYADRAELKTFNAVNATLAACAGKGLATKAKGVFREKMLTQYTVPVDAE